MAKPLEGLDPTKLYTKSDLSKFLAERGPRDVKQWLRDAYGEEEDSPSDHVLVPGHEGYMKHLRYRGKDANHPDKGKPYRSALKGERLIAYCMLAQEYGRKPGTELPCEPQAEKPKPKARKPKKKAEPEAQNALELPATSVPAKPPAVSRPEPPPVAGGNRKKDEDKPSPSVGKAAASSDDPRIDVMVGTLGSLLEEVRGLRGELSQHVDAFSSFSTSTLERLDRINTSALTKIDLRQEVGALLSPEHQAQRVFRETSLEIHRHMAELLDGSAGPQAVDDIVAQILAGASDDELATACEAAESASVEAAAGDQEPTSDMEMELGKG